jgi:DNA-binding Lrp family transcriptional regulator
MKNQQKYIDNIVSKILNETLEEKASEMVKKIKSKVEEDMEEGEWTEIDMSEESEMCSECGGMMYEGECSECGMHPQEESYDKTDKFDYVETDGDEYEEEVGEGNAFTGALDNARKLGKKTFKVGDEEFKVNESNKNLRLTENELIDVIEKLVKEEIEKEFKVKDNIRKTAKPRGLATYEKAVRGSKTENDDYIKSVTKKMKDYLKDASKGDYDMNPKIFPAGNGQLVKMDKKAYIPSSAVEDYTDNFTAAGQENLVYDEINPNEDWITDNIEGSSRTGNNSEWANAVETPTNKKRNKIRKDNLLGAVKAQAYNKSPQPIVTDEAGESTSGGHSNLKLNNKANKILKQLESTEDKNNKLIKEEFNKMTHLIKYNRKTQ